MKFLSAIFMLLTLAACDPYHFGFEKNPATVLDLLLKAIQNKDLETFVQVTDKEALCTYGNEAGLNYLNEQVKISLSDVSLKWKTKEGHSKLPEFVGYWSYYSSRFLIDISDKKNSQLLGQVVVDCHYGGGDEKNNDFLNLKLNRYRIKECRLVSILPANFESLAVPEQCEGPKVEVDETEFTATASSDSRE